METLVEIEGITGDMTTIAGDGVWDQGIYLATGVKGIYDPPVKVVYEEPGNFPGARFLNYRILRRDIVFGVEILNDKKYGGDSWLSRDSFWRKQWAYDRDTTIHVTTDESGHRAMKCRLGGDGTHGGIDVSMNVDPNDLTSNLAAMSVIAGDPFWYEDDVVYPVVTKTDTRFSPGLFNIGTLLLDLEGGPPSETLSITVDPSDGRGGLNPTDQYIWGKWTLPGSKTPIPTLPFPFPPGIAIPFDTAPYTTWVIPDYSYEDPKQANRTLQMPGLIIGEDCVVDTDPRVEQVTSASGSQVWARMNGVRFRYPIPPYTKSKTFKIKVSGCAPGQMLTLRIPRPWSRPWGLE